MSDSNKLLNLISTTEIEIIKHCVKTHNYNALNFLLYSSINIEVKEVNDLIHFCVLSRDIISLEMILNKKILKPTELDDSAPSLALQMCDNKSFELIIENREFKTEEEGMEFTGKVFALDNYHLFTIILNKLNLTEKNKSFIFFTSIQQCKYNSMKALIDHQNFKHLNIFEFKKNIIKGYQISKLYNYDKQFFKKIYEIDFIKKATKIYQQGISLKIEKNKIYNKVKGFE